MATRGKKGITRFKVPEGYSGRKNKHIPEDEYEYEYNVNLPLHIKYLEESGYKVTAPRVLSLIRANVNKRHGYPEQKEKKRSPWHIYLKEKMGPLIKEGYTFKEAMEEVAGDWAVEKDRFKADLEYEQRAKLLPAGRKRKLPDAPARTLPGRRKRVPPDVPPLRRGAKFPA